MKTTKNTSRNIFALIAFLFLTGSASRCLAQSKTTVNNIVIVHGAVTDASGWESVYKILVKHGYHVTLVQNPTSSLANDVAATNLALERQDGPVVLVGHSWGGTVITQAGNADIVKSLVYVAAFIPDAGESTLDWVRTVKEKPKNPQVPDANGNIFMDKASFQQTFAKGQSKEKSDFMCDSQIPFTLTSFKGRITEAAWKSKPVYAVKPSDDETIDMGLEDRMFKRANAKVTHVKGSHTLFMTQPEAIAGVIETAAREASK